ncbi:AidA/PixA family protein [Dokdonia sp.]|uniref:AidA/PixA family protein n=1 Tax=Dokdonia sp. TaxID=2024995 RepID=UPI00326541C0
MATDIVNVGIFIDADTIISTQGGNTGNPVFVNNSANTIYMVSQKANEISGHGAAELNVKMHPNQDIRWRASTLTFGGQYTVNLYAISVTQGESLLDRVEPARSSEMIAEINPNDIQNPNVLEANLGYWSATAYKEGNVTYNFYFQIMKPHADGTLETVGRFYWDPYIDISWDN